MSEGSDLRLGRIAAGGVRVLISNPLHSIIRRGDSTVVVFSALGGGADGPFDTNRRWPPEDAADTVVLEARTAGGAVESLRAYRGITTGDELYFLRTADGALVLADSFRNALVQLPRSERIVSDASIVDHHLFRTTPGHATYVEGIQRLGHGEELQWSPVIGLTRRLAARLALPVRTSDFGAEARRVDTALERAMAPLREAPNAANLLSGGVDSTLLQTYLPKDSPSVSAAIDSPEFALEVDYALHASRLAGTRHHLQMVQETEYLALLERSIESVGLPPHHLQSVLIDIALQSDFRTFITGQFADALFGLASAQHAVPAWRWRALTRIPGVAAVARGVGGVFGRRYEILSRTVERLRLPARSPGAFAMGFAVYSDMALACALFGPEAVSARLLARLQYVLDRVEDADLGEHAAAQQLELGHWLDFFCDDTISLWRQLAHARGKALAAPFMSAEVVEAARAITSPHRFFGAGGAKPVLKRILSERLPAYPTAQVKGGSGLPFVRYFATGPLRTAFERYELPSFVPDGRRQEVTAQTTWMTWNLLTFALWTARVLENTSLQVIPGTHELRWQSAASGDPSDA